jgi:hypothetical protein
VGTKKHKPDDLQKEQSWRAIFRDWKASGLSRIAYCRQHQVPLSSFTRWQKKIATRDRQARRSEKPQTPPTATASFVPVEVINMAPLTIQFRSGHSLIVPPGFDPKHLEAVCKVLEG